MYVIMGYKEWIAHLTPKHNYDDFPQVERSDSTLQVQMQ